jgi:hypothetical protein
MAAAKPLEKCDIVVGLMAGSDADHVGLPLTKSYEGLSQSYPGVPSVIAYCGPETLKNAKDLFLNLPSPVPKVFLGAPAGPDSKERSLLNLMAYAQKLQAKAIVTIDADLSTVKRTWIGRLAGPVLSGQASLTSPFYHSLKFDTPVTTLVAYPLFRALFGRRIRQPFLCDRAFSGELNDIFLAKKDWPKGLPYFMTEMTLSLLAIANGAKICQSFMANPRIGSALLPIDTATTASLFIDACRSLFELIVRYPGLWLKVSRSRPTPVTGTDLTPPVSPARTLASPNQFLESLRTVVTKEAKFWSGTFQGAYDHLYRSLAYDDYRLLTVDPAEWANLLFDSALAYRRLDEAGRQTLLECLSAAFLGRLLTWIRDAAGLTLGQMEARNEEEARMFESSKSRLVAGWGD